jgi:hypothetical protein
MAISKLFDIPAKYSVWLQSWTGVFSFAGTFVFLFLLLETFSAYSVVKDQNSHVRHGKIALAETKENQLAVQSYEQDLQKLTPEQIGFQRKKFNLAVSSEYMKERLKKWQKQLKIQNITIQTSTIKSSPLNANLKVITYSIEAKVPNDKILYQLVEKVQSESHGLVSVTNITLKRTKDSPALVKDEKLIEGTIDFDWTFLS